MSLEKIEALEVRVKKLVDLVVELKRDKTFLEEELKATQERLRKQEEISQSWETERTDIRARIERVLKELDFLDATDASGERR